MILYTLTKVYQISVISLSTRLHARSFKAQQLSVFSESVIVSTHFMRPHPPITSLFLFLSITSRVITVKMSKLKCQITVFVSNTPKANAWKLIWGVKLFSRFIGQVKKPCVRLSTKHFEKRRGKWPFPAYYTTNIRLSEFLFSTGATKTSHRRAENCRFKWYRIPAVTERIQPCRLIVGCICH